MRLRFPILAAALSLVLVACIGYPIDVSTTPEDVDFSRFETFHVVPVVEQPNPVNREVKADTIKSLVAKGYREVPPLEADLIVLFQGQAVRQQRATHGDFFGGCCVIREYVAGTVEIDIHSRNDGKRIWRGVAQVDLPTAKNLVAEAARAVSAILEEYPEQGAVR